MPRALGTSEIAGVDRVFPPAPPPNDDGSRLLMALRVHAANGFTCSTSSGAPTATRRTDNYGGSLGKPRTVLGWKYWTAVIAGSWQQRPCRLRLFAHAAPSTMWTHAKTRWETSATCWEN